MTPRERVLTAMRRTGKADRTPFEISWGAFTPGLMDIYRQRTGSMLDPAEYFDFDTRLVNIDPTRKKVDFAARFTESPPASTVWDEWGYGGVRGSLEHFLEYRYHPLANFTTADQVWEYSWPDVDADYRFEGVVRQTRDYQKRGYAVAGELYLTIFETSWLMRGMETLLLDFFRNQEVAHAIFENITNLRIRQAEKYAQIGVDILRLGDDVATQKGPVMSLELYREFLKPRMARIINAAKKIKPDILVFMHSDGAMADFIPEYIDIGVEIVNPLQPECNDLAAIGQKFGDNISFWGGIGTQSTMPFGSPDDVKAKVREVRELLGGRGGLLLAPSHILEPEVPWENVLAFIEAAREPVL